MQRSVHRATAISGPDGIVTVAREGVGLERVGWDGAEGGES